jgi:DNA-binding CsgD family transcriptional regulator
LEAIASPLTAAVRDLIGADSGSFFWLDAEGGPVAFYHDSARAEVKDLFVTRFEELFSGPDEINMMTMMTGTGQAVGRALDPEFSERFWRGNVYRYLCVPCGHRYMIDARIDVNGRGRALFCGWNPPDRPFTQADADVLTSICKLMQHAAAIQRPNVRWRSKGGQGHFITDRTGQTLAAISPDAESLLTSSQLLQQHISLTSPIVGAPSFARILGQMMEGQATAEIRLPVADGRLVARGSLIRTIDKAQIDSGQMLVTLDVETPTDVAAVEYLMTFRLSPLQREIALFAMLGGERSECATEFGVSSEALKKHLRAIFDATGTVKWPDLAALPI